MTDSRDVKLAYLENKMMQNGDEDAYDKYMSEVNHRKSVDMVFQTAFPEEFERQHLVITPEDFDCLRALYSDYEKNCGYFDDYSLKYVKYLVNVCETGTEWDWYQAATRIAQACMQY